MNSASTVANLTHGKEFVNLLEDLLASDWTLHFKGNVNYTPLGKEFGDWICEPFDSVEKIIEIVRKKIDLTEDVAISIFYADSSHGADLLFESKTNRVIFGWSIDIVKEESGNINLSWYAEKIARGLSKRFSGLALYSCEQDSGGKTLQARSDVVN
jgi:hypothetical protein